ncbi:hypothetical protein [Bifidobacterium vespertilionis]|uniref:Uncharacterized protein n=1 Tax=Bifidobacterium vespertilionis TaxID=2562524 RepID=A0A5J5E3K4_9BIFI|nr:hypothetical protein [Bifidobacterium vespertilionis]KAA8819601.1 hypothetical protein EMO90_08180 [Bifidobacterium vespertilionis]KAA8823391.1 hypothetical protein EM848_05450 [Bifidobacterium vespertilionis]
MDSAVRLVPTMAPVLTSVAETNERFHGEIPSAVKFACPYCNRPVIPVAERARRRSPIHYFRHARDDEWAHRCVLYQAGGDASMDTQVPPLAMTLRRDPRDGMFGVEVGVRRRASAYLRRVLTPKDAMTVDGVGHSLADLAMRRGAAVPFEDPIRDPRRRITIPDRWWRYVGRAQECRGVLIFSDVFGVNGGRYLPIGSALQSGEDYYVVSGQADPRGMRSRFDLVSKVGRVRGPGNLTVHRVRVSSASGRWDRADDWLGGYGYCLSEFDRAARLAWPPSLRTSGADEPLFLNATPVYASPYLADDDAMDDVVDNRAYLPNAREVGLVGFRRLPQTRPSRMRAELESFCLFLKPDARMPWTSVIISRTRPDDLHPFDPAHADGPEPGAGGEQAEPPTVIRPTSAGMAVALKRMGFDVGNAACRGLAVARERKRERGR